MHDLWVVGHGRLQVSLFSVRIQSGTWSERNKTYCQSNEYGAIFEIEMANIRRYGFRAVTHRGQSLPVIWVGQAGVHPHPAIGQA